MSNLPNLPSLKASIDSILTSYLKVESFSNTKGEEAVDAFFNETVGSMAYFKNNSELYGQYETGDSKFNRHVNYALYLGGEETYVLIHHSDVVNIDNYGEFKNYALNPEKLKEMFLKDHGLLSEEAMVDLKSDDYLFGRGVADMKSGGAIELALLEHYSNHKFNKNILVLSLPDEENESLGMRSAINLLSDLKEKYHLNYKLMINTEPHQRMKANNGVISQGSIGKLNVFVHVKGVLAHAGKALEGINSNGLLASIVQAVDLNEVFINETDTEMSIPPTWITMRDNKKIYDISFPSMSYGLLNVLSFTDTPSMILNKLKIICQEAADLYIDHVNKKRQVFSNKTHRDWQDFKKTPCVFTLNEFIKDQSKLSSYPEDLENLLSKTNDDEPLIIIGVLPPYYPAITNDDQEELLSLVNTFTKKEYNQAYDNRMYFTGISDLSYSKLPSTAIESETKNILGWKTNYYIPFEVLKTVEMPCVNIGPWGKDFHKPSERVLKEDVYKRTPEIINYVVNHYKGGKNVQKCYR